jgi:hypothetical protein
MGLIWHGPRSGRSRTFRAPQFWSYRHFRAVELRQRESSQFKVTRVTKHRESAKLLQLTKGNISKSARLLPHP